MSTSARVLEPVPNADSGVWAPNPTSLRSRDPNVGGTVRSLLFEPVEPMFGRLFEATEREQATISVMVAASPAMTADAIGFALAGHEGFNVVHVVHSARTAISALKRRPVDVAVIDHRLDDGDGISCARSLRTLVPTVKCLILGGAAIGPQATSVSALAVNDGCDGLISQSEPFEALVDAIRRAHAGEAVFTAAALTSAVRALQGTSVATLSARELQVLNLMVRGASTKELSDQLFISPHTVRSHVRQILQKLDARTRLEAVTSALKAGIVSMPEDAA